MQAEVVWLDQAVEDLDAIFVFIAKDNPSAALDYIDGLEEACKRLRDFPNSGRFYDSQYQTLIYRNHLIFYKFSISTKVLKIIKIVDGRQDYLKLVIDLPEN